MRNYDYLPDDEGKLKSEIARLERRIYELESEPSPVPQLNWRRGGAQANPELPTLPAEIATPSVGVSGVLFSFTYLGAKWEPGLWWRQCKWWCYRSEIERTLPKDKTS